MRLRFAPIGSSILLCFCLAADSALLAQDFGATIQLPTQSFFGINTVVSVPDGGSISLGGNRGSMWGSTQRSIPGLANLTGPGRLFNNHAIGGGQFASNMSVHVRIISLSEMEADLLSQLPPDKPLSDYARPEPIALTLRETAFASAFPDRNDRLNSTNSRNVTRSNERLDSSRIRSTAPSSSETDTNHSKVISQDGENLSRRAILSAPVRRDQVVDPNGSAAVQRQADFMSQNVGRKKK